jgi:hypothetical protein
MIKVSLPLVKNLSLLSASVILTLLLLEVLLRYSTPFPISMTSNRVAHDELLYVLDPDFPDIDRLGFRNRTGPRDQTIFAIGDSHTYGYNVTWDKSWPIQLQKMLNLEVYNFGVPSYNIYQYYRLFEMSSQYAPKYVIIGLNPSNDLVHKVCDILRLDFWKDRILELGLSNTYCDREYGEESYPDDTTRGIKQFLKFNVAVVSAVDHLIRDLTQKYFDRRDENLADPGTIDNSEADSFSIVQGSIELKVKKNV